MSRSLPGYVALHESGELIKRAARLQDMLEPCTLCPRRCGAHRLAGELGECGAGTQASVARACHHRGEEPPISGTRGAGTIFFAGCNLRCVYCQNHQISRDTSDGTVMDAPTLASEMLRLQDRGVHNIALITPSHVVPQIVAALDLAAGRGLRLPLVYNTSAYDDPAVLRELDGLVDIYLPDLKYGDDEQAAILSTVTDYVARSRNALREMARQVGPLRLDGEGVAVRGLIVRHLVLPNGLAASERVLRFIASELGTDTAVSLMAQYCPPTRQPLPPLLQRSVRPAEYAAAVALAEELGLTQGWVQSLDATDAYVPDFDDAHHPFER